MTARRLPDISESFEAMWTEYVLTSPLVSLDHLRSIARHFSVSVRGKSARSAQGFAGALLNRVDSKDLTGHLREVVEARQLDLLPLEGARAAYRALSQFDEASLSKVIESVSDNKDLKNEVRRLAAGRKGALRSAPPGLLRRVVMAELCTIPRDLALQRLAKAGVQCAA